jgi:mannose-6-phosphate isomerase-like protein (cupin superfamily)
MFINVKAESPPGRWFSPGTTVSCTNKTDRHDITEILLKMALNIITQLTHQISDDYFMVQIRNK